MIVKRTRKIQRKRVQKRGALKSKRKNMKRKYTLKKKKKSTLKKKKKSRKKRGGRDETRHVDNINAMNDNDYIPMSDDDDDNNSQPPPSFEQSSQQRRSQQRSSLQSPSSSSRTLPSRPSNVTNIPRGGDYTGPYPRRDILGWSHNQTG